VPSPNGRRVCIRIDTFEACSGFTRVTARRIAQPPKVTFVTRLRPGQLPNRVARQLLDLSTIIWVEPSSTDDSLLQDALPIAAVEPLLVGLDAAAVELDPVHQAVARGLGHAFCANGVAGPYEWNGHSFRM